IEEYLADKIDLDFGTTWENEQYKDESINIKKSVNSRLRRVVVASVGIMIALIFGIFFIISPLVDRLFYNPSTVTVGEVEHDIYFDMQAITELNYPGYTLSSLVDIDRLGFGKYDISYFRTNLFTEETSYVYSKIKRNWNITNHTSWTNDRSFNFKTIRVPDWMTAQDAQEQKERVISHVKQLSPVSYTSSWITFETDLTMEELHQLELAYPNIDFVWVGIRIASPNEGVSDLLGFSTRSTKLTVDKPDIEKYPAFDYIEWLVHPIGFDREARRIEPRGYELHFKDLLKYTVDRKDAINVLEKRPNRYKYYEEALDYVEENGVKTYGTLVYANAQDLIELVENEEILTIELSQVIASKRYIH
ncbi:MAG: hypothetical protein GX053_06570, partial [Tissierella sp.]|nr:hypothetical protein [Tissierella sp.]